MSWRLALCVVLGSCGFSSSALPRDAAIGEAPASDAAIDAAVDAATDAPIDAAASGGDCLARWLDHTVQLATPDWLMRLSTATDERDPWISPNGKRLYFASGRNGNNDIFFSVRLNTSDPFINPAPYLNLNTPHNEDRASLTDDQTLLALSSESGPSDRAVILMTQPSLPNTFASPDQRHLGDVNASNSDQRDPFLSGDGLRLYLSVDPQGAAKSQVMLAVRSDRDADFSTPQPVPGINDGSDNSDPAVAADERILLFTSSRPNGGGGGDDLWYATRQDRSQPFGPPAPVPMVNGGANDGDPMLSADGCELYFASNRGRSDYELYVARVVR